MEKIHIDIDIEACEADERLITSDEARMMLQNYLERIDN